jgi:tRNA(adenine34) deaminase
MLTDADIKPMQRAIAASADALAIGNMPFGASLVTAQGELLHVSANNQVTNSDCTGHAELVLVREVSAAHGVQALRGGTVYASGEPCAMCCGAMFWAGVSRVVFAATQDDIAQALGGPVLPMRSADVLAGASPSVRVEGPLLGAEAVAILKRFKSS